MKVKGTPVSKNILLKYLESAVAEDFKTALFTNEEPLPNFPVNLGYIGRVIVPLEGVMELAGVYEKEIESRKYRSRKHPLYCEKLLDKFGA